MTEAPVVPVGDRVGLALAGLLVTWTAIAGLVTDRSPLEAIGTILLAVAAFAAGRGATRYVAPWVLPAAILFLGYAVFLHAPGTTFSRVSGQGFLGYANAKAAFYVQAAFATAVLLAGYRSPIVAVLSLPSIAFLAMVPIRAGSLGAFLTSMLLVPAILVALVGKARRATVVLAAILAFGAITTSFVLAAEFARGPDSRAEPLAERIDRGRAVGWAESYRILAERPAVGAGPGGFADVAGAAASNWDPGWAHNEFLQQGAETGLPGLALLLGLTGWIYWSLWRRSSATAAVAALAVSALVFHACAEYLFHFPLLPATTAALAGTATSAGARDPRGP